jgi:lycopene cyclase domain-containing protein
MNYLVLDAIMLSVAAALFVFRKPSISRKQFIVMLLSLTVLTVIFDNVIISLQIVTYHPEHLVGIYIGKIPIEDFSYTLAACLLVPVLWERDDA